MWRNLKTFYNSREWNSIRQQVLYDCNFTCRDCGGIAEEVHHEEVLTLENVNDPNISLNIEKLAPLCTSCHNRRHKRFSSAKHVRKEKVQTVYVVWGSPLSGKTTYVKQHMKIGDLVLDVDNIWECISLQPRYVHPNSLLKNMFAIRELIIDNIKTRKGTWESAWVIGGFPDKYAREKLINDLGAEEVYIDVKKDECIKRAKERPEGYIEYIEKWWDKLTK